MKLIFCDINEQMIEAWNKYFTQDSNIEIYHGSIFSLHTDAIVSPANSFGFMDGGLDLQISRFFGWHVQERLQELIKHKHHGELIVGNAEIIQTDHDIIPFVISAPTMRVPMILRNSVNVYLATRALLLLVRYGEFQDGKLIRDSVKKVAIPGMGTGVGRVPLDICALQMKKAVDDFYYEKLKFPNSWYEAQKSHQLLYQKITTDLQIDNEKE